MFITNVYCLLLIKCENIRRVMEEEFRPFTEVQISHCENFPTEVKMESGSPTAVLTRQHYSSISWFCWQELIDHGFVNYIYLCINTHTHTVSLSLDIDIDLHT